MIVDRSGDAHAFCGAKQRHTDMLCEPHIPCSESNLGREALGYTELEVTELKYCLQTGKATTTHDISTARKPQW